MEQKPIELEVKTKGFEEATEKISAMAEAIEGLPDPVQVMIKAHDCTFHIYPNQTQINNEAPMLTGEDEQENED